MARPGTPVRNESLLNAALEGLEIQKQRIEEQIREVKSLLGKDGQRAKAGQNGSGAKRSSSRLSPAARKRIAAAQKRRWAEYRKSAGKAAE